MMDTRRKFWIAAQVSLVIPTLVALALVAEMTVAEPGKSYKSRSGQLIRCEALVRPIKRSSGPRCATFGSKETNKPGYLLAWTALAACSALLWWTSKPGRGVTISRE